MRIRKRKVPFPLSSLTPVPISLSDPHLINRSAGVVQLNPTSLIRTIATTISTSATTPSTAESTAAAAVISSPPSPPVNPSSYSYRQDPLSVKLTDKIDTTRSHLDRQLSDHHQPQQPIGKPTNGPDSSSPRWPHQQECLELFPTGDARKQEKDKNLDSGEEDILRSDTPTEVLARANPSQQVALATRTGCEGGNAFPLKKRRGSSAGRGDEEMLKENKKLKTSRMKTKMNKKCSNDQPDIAPDGDHEQQEETETSAAKLSLNKKRVRGTTLLEGSRCSRVNGRGWRCCQQTLVGYSLCEHHLGKGRLRSMTSVRNRSPLGGGGRTSKTTSTTSQLHKNIQSDQISPMSSEPSSASLEKKQLQPNDFLSGPQCNVEKKDNQKEEKKLSLKTKKRMKLGVVKARSISSLLGQTNNDIRGSVAENIYNCDSLRLES